MPEPEPHSVRGVLATPRLVLMNDPQFDWARPRATRRVLVTVLGGLIAFIAVGIGLGAVIGPFWTIGIVVFAMFGMVMTIGTLNVSIRGMTGLKDADLDEWQRTNRNVALSKCWWPVIILLGGAAMVAAYYPVAPALKNAIVMAAFLVSLTLPITYLAWTLADEPEA